MSFVDYSQACMERVDNALKQQISSEPAHAKQLQAAAEYSLFNGGKRIRPLLVYATAHALGADTKHADYPAVAVEMIHAYSLVHDDLPAMDDDNLRRGKPTCHIAFNEATAILAGDALQTQAFSVLSQANTGLSAQQQLSMIQILASSSGLVGMAGGQSLDLEAVDKEVDLDYLENMHLQKTGALIKASVLMGAYCHKEVSADTLASLANYAQAIGLAFQVQDDILDVISDTQTLGKTQGADIANNKPTYVSLLGLKGAQEKALQLHQQATDALKPLGDRACHLVDIANYIIERTH